MKLTSLGEIAGMLGLEPRLSFSGSVAVEVSNGILSISGDDSANQILVRRGDRYGDVEISALDNTVINGRRTGSVLPFNGVHDILVKLGAGDDRIHFSAVRLRGGIAIEGGRGDDQYEIRNSRVFGDVVVGFSRDDDALAVRRSFFGNDLTFDDRKGASSIAIRNCVIDDNLNLQTGNKRDDLTISNSTNNGRSVIKTAGGRDTLTITGSEFKKSTTLDAGSKGAGNGRTGNERDVVHREVVKRFDFDQGEQGWTPGLSNYNLSGGRTVEDYLKYGPAEVKPIEPYNGPPKRGYYLAGDNLSDQLFLFISQGFGEADGLRPNASYRVHFEITLATQIPPLSAGGSQGLSVGILSRAPEVRVIESSSELTTSYLVGNDGESRAAHGKELDSVGEIKSDTPRMPGDQNPPYISVGYSHDFRAIVTSNEVGQLWLLAGPQSAFERGMSMFFERVSIRLTPVE